jgi:hypothetical protein
MTNKLIDAIEAILPEPKKHSPDDDTHDLAKILGWNDCLLEINKRLLEVLVKERIY